MACHLAVPAHFADTPLIREPTRSLRSLGPALHLVTQIAKAQCPRTQGQQMGTTRSTHQMCGNLDTGVSGFIELFGPRRAPTPLCHR